MPIDWPFDENIRLGGTGEQRKDEEYGNRQAATARAILADMRGQPGVILADEVGMGKTYVALAVAASVMRATKGEGQPVIVMMPTGLRPKWKREWAQFKAICCDDREPLGWVRQASPSTPAEFFHLFDKSKRRPHLIWMTTNCFSLRRANAWIKLAMIRLARNHTKMDQDTKQRLYKWATDLTRLKSKGRLDPELIERLMNKDLEQWHSILVAEGIWADNAPKPVPDHLLNNQYKIADEHWKSLVAVLQGEDIPWRRRGAFEQRIKSARHTFNQACQDIYWQWIACVPWHASLLILDEAHHAKNDSTQLAQLLRPDDDDEPEGSPLLWEKFDRMLFLTATPFQLGHQELVRILHSFAGARWKGKDAPDRSREDFVAALEELEDRLDENRKAGRYLDRLWGKLTPAQIGFAGPVTEEKVWTWWQRIKDGSEAEQKNLVTAVKECIRTKEEAEDDSERPWGGLRRWVIRHNRPARLPAKENKPDMARRQAMHGAAIVANDGKPLPSGGLPIASAGALPFLLAARAQGELAAGSARGRAYFAEGLCSSYEAFHHTRDHRGDGRDVNDEGKEIQDGDQPPRDDGEGPLIPVDWYEEKIGLLIPSKKAGEEKRYRHPKIKPVVDRVVRLWESGEKVLVFCFYRQTVRALREHVGRRIDQKIVALAGEKLKLDKEAQVRDWLKRISRRLAAPGSPFQKGIVEVLEAPFDKEEFKGLSDHRPKLVDLLAAYVRTPSFVARYLPLELPEVREALAEEERRSEVIPRGVAAMCKALQEQNDASEMTLMQRVEEFLRFARDLKMRQQPRADDEEEEEEGDTLEKYHDAIDKSMSEDDEEADEIGTRRNRALEVVRMVDGTTKRETRERLMLAFNSPLMPEVLISSGVLGEGVDLHRFCRHVIHHDLCWNPSTLEQRTGRLDRIGSKAENAHQSIIVYEPFLAGSADEKMFRVVRDRERWFQIVMGQKFVFDEAMSEELSRRVPLPAELAKKMTFDLSRFGKPGKTAPAPGTGLLPPMGLAPVSPAPDEEERMKGTPAY